MFKKLKVAWVVLSRLLLYKVTGSRGDEFWGWLYKRVHYPKCRDYANPILVWYLLDTALQAEEHVRALAVFRHFQEIIELSWTEKHKKQIIESIDEAEKIDFGAEHFRKRS